MPGIAGLISDRAEDLLFVSMRNSMNHLNYAEDSDIKNGVHFSRIHLNFINTTKQPLHSADSRYTLVFYGEIFSVQNVPVLDSKDSAVFFLSLIEKYGLEIVSKINGQFSASLHDHQSKTTYLISDRFGTRPLYYSLNNNRLLFASEVKAILKDKINKNINLHSIADLFAFGQLFGNKTLFEGISLVPPGTIIKYNQNKVEEIAYWTFPYSEEVYRKQGIHKRTSDEFQNRLEQILINASKRQSANADKILVPLSGGLDSRYVAALYHYNGLRNVQTFTMGPDESEDQQYGGEVARTLHFPHTKFDVQPETTWEAANRFSYYSDAMSMISGPLQIFEPLHYFSNKTQIIAASQMCDALFGSTLFRKRIRILQHNNKPRHTSDEVLTNLFKGFDQQQVSQLFNTNAYKKIEGLYRIEPQKYCDNVYHPLHNYFRLLMNGRVRRGTLGGNIVLNLRHETRMLSYDNDVFNFGWNLPIAYREHQYLYRKAFCNLFPDLGQIKRQGINLKIDASNARYELKILENKIATLAMKGSLKNVVKYYKPWAKVSYTSYSKWFKNELREKLVLLLSNKNLKCAELVNVKYVEVLLNEHLTGKRDNTAIIWQVINLEHFYTNFVD
jgi:hypothetical protein